MPTRKKTLALVIHLPLEVKERIDTLRTKLHLKELSDVIIMAVDQYFNDLHTEGADDTK